MMLGGIFSWLIFGLVIYLLFFRRGGMMGCCGSHNHNAPDQTCHTGHDNRYWGSSEEEIIDLKEEDKHVKTKA